MTRKRSRIAVLMDNAFSFFQEEPRVGIARYAEEAGIDAMYFGMGMLRPTNPDDDARMGFFEFLTPAEFDGLILVSSSLHFFGDDPITSFLRRAKPMPVVSIGPSVIGEDNVIADNRGGIAAMMKHLIEDHGMRDFAFVSGPRSHAESNIRLETFRAALDQAGIRHDERREYEGTLLPPAGFAAVEELIEHRGLMPRAIVCANDLMAVGVRDALLARGLSVPFDVAVTGFDDIALTRSASSQFTTVQQPFDLMGYLAARKLHSLIRGEASAPLGMIPTELRVRGSCGCFDLQNRKSEAAGEQDDAVFASIKAKTDRLWTGGMLESDTLALRRAWLDIVQEAIKANRPTYSLEKTLMNASLAGHGGIDRSGSAFIFQQLYSILIEENSQTVFTQYWRDFYSAFFVRLAIDRFQEEINKDLNWTTHANLFLEIAKQCKARSFHVARFIDGREISKGAEIVFSYDQDGSSARWSPQTGSWLPENAGSLVVNMINFGDDRFGYFLMDAKVSGRDIFETLRIRFCGIFHDMSVLRHNRELNESLIQEIGIRQESEGKLRDALGLLEHFAIKDQLTDLHNRRGFLSLADQQIKFMRRQKIEFSVLFADMDGLKTINDQWGHKEGDLAIQGAARALKESLRDSDIVARLGGDEFTALVNNTDDSSISLIKSRIRSNCERISLELGRPWKISMSVGHFHADADCSLEVEAMLAKADFDLYEEKKRNKNKPG